MIFQCWMFHVGAVAMNRDGTIHIKNRIMNFKILISILKKVFQSRNKRKKPSSKYT